MDRSGPSSFQDDEASNMSEASITSRSTKRQRVDDEFAVASTSKRVKPLPWVAYLENTRVAIQLIYLHKLLDLPEQSVIREDCENYIDEHDFFHENKLTACLDLEVIITIYSKSHSEKYETGNGWIPMAGQLMLKKHSKIKVYELFEKIRDFYVPEMEMHGIVLRLLLQYHHPLLCCQIDNHEISLDDCTASWAKSLLAGICQQDVTDSMWDYIFEQHNSFMIYFLFLSIIDYNREKIVSIVNGHKEHAIMAIKSLPKLLYIDEIEDILNSAKSFGQNTPSSFQTFFYSFLFGKEREKLPHNLLPQCLPYLANEMIEKLYGLSNVTAFNCIAIDCRTIEQYNGGHLSAKNAIHIDCKLINIRLLESAIQKLVLKLNKNRADDGTGVSDEISQIILMGSGLSDDEKCVQLAVKLLLKKQMPFVSILMFGYPEVHKCAQMIDKLDIILSGHNSATCCVCNPNVVVGESVDDSPSTSRFARLRRSLRQTHENVKKQLFSCRRSTSTSECEAELENIQRNYNAGRDNETVNDEVFHERTAPPYTEPKYEIVPIDMWLNKTNVEIFKCKEIVLGGAMYKSRLIITPSDLILLRKKIMFDTPFYLVIVNSSVLNVEKIITDKNHLNQMAIYFDRTGPNVPFSNIRLMLAQDEMMKFVNLFKDKYLLSLPVLPTYDEAMA